MLANQLARVDLVELTKQVSHLGVVPRIHNADLCFDVNGYPEGTYWVDTYVKNSGTVIAFDDYGNPDKAQKLAKIVTLHLAEFTEEIDDETLRKFGENAVKLVLEINDVKATGSKTYDDIFDELSKKYGLNEYEFTLAVKVGTQIISGK